MSYQKTRYRIFDALLAVLVAVIAVLFVQLMSIHECDCGPCCERPYEYIETEEGYEIEPMTEEEFEALQTELRKNNE